MKIFVDTNIFIDILLQREPFYKESIDIYKLCENDIFVGFIAPITINNIFYICRKSLNSDLVKDFLIDIATHFKIATMNQNSLSLATSLQISDFEDAMQCAMALENECDYIITRNVKDFKHIIQIPILEPANFLQLLQQ